MISKTESDIPIPIKKHLDVKKNPAKTGKSNCLRDAGVSQMPRRQSNSENQQTQVDEEQFELYAKQIIEPALQRSLRRESVQFKIIRVLRGRKGEVTPRLVLQLTERDALLLLSQKPTFGFNCCTVKRYVFIP